MNSIGRFGGVGSESDETATDLQFAKLVVEQLWPGAAPEIHEWRPWERSTDSLVLLPSARTVRALAPPLPRRVAAASLAPNSSPVSTKQKLARASARVLLRSGFGRIAPYRFSIRREASAEPCLGDVLADILGERVELVINIGTPRANRKPVVRVLNRSGSRTLAFAKIGLTEYTRSLVMREGRALDDLGQADVPFAFPSAISLVEFATNPVLVMSPLATRGKKGIADSAQRRLVISQLSAAFGSTEDPVVSGRFVSSLRHRLLGQRGNRLTAGLEDLLAQFEETFAGMTQQLGVWHGDFTPWNMRTAAGRTSIWDWEQFAPDVPAGLDETHYCVNSRTQREGFTEVSILRGLRDSTWPYPNRLSARLAEASYLATVATRYVVASHGEGGKAAYPQAEVLMTSLSEVIASGRSVARR